MGVNPSSAKKGMRILITGGFGYLGARIADDLKARGHNVVILARESTRHAQGGAAVLAWAKRFTIVLGDITKPETLTAAFTKATRGGKIDAVIHTASVNENVCARDPRLAMEVNGFGTGNVAQAAAVAGVKRFLYFSTFHVYGASVGSVSESSAIAPTHMYGLSHFVGESLSRSVASKSGMELVLLRPSNGIGAPAIATVDRWTLLMLDLCKQAHEHGAMHLGTSGHQKRDFVAISDICAAVRILLKAPAQELADPVFNVGSGSAVSVRDVAKTIQKEYEALYRRAVPLSVPDGKDTSSKLSFSIRKLRGLGFEPKTDIANEARETLRMCEVFRK